jgi:hypothetical protein
MFVYERKMPNQRGLPALDDDGMPIYEEEDLMKEDSSDESCNACKIKSFKGI